MRHSRIEGGGFKARPDPGGEVEPCPPSAPGSAAQRGSMRAAGDIEAQPIKACAASVLSGSARAACARTGRPRRRKRQDRHHKASSLVIPQLPANCRAGWRVAVLDDQRDRRSVRRKRMMRPQRLRCHRRLCESSGRTSAASRCPPDQEQEPADQLEQRKRGSDPQGGRPFSAILQARRLVAVASEFPAAGNFHHLGEDLVGDKQAAACIVLAITPPPS